MSDEVSEAIASGEHGLAAGARTARRVAAIDCGTNSIRLLVADVDVARFLLSDLRRDMRIVRLGEGVDQTGRLSPAALDRTMAALGEYAGEIRRLAPEAVRMVATSATRDAENSQEFTTRVKDVLGVVPEVVTGDEEAGLSFTGATAGLTADFAGPFLVADIGGGSTELVLGDSAGVSAAAVHEIAVRLLAMTRERRAAIGVMHPGRVDVIGGGALILDRVMTRFGFPEVLVSEHDILDGIAWSLVPPVAQASR